MKFGLIAMSGITAIFAVGLGVTLAASLASHGKAKNESLLAALPRPPANWKVTDLPVASSEEMKRAVDELLGYDNAVFREYQIGERSFSIFVTYWKPRKIHPRLVSVHTPDVCWVSNGWKMGAFDYGWKFAPAILNFRPAQYRVFKNSTTGLNVLYWQMIDGKASPYVGDPALRESSSLVNLWNDFKVTSGEQFFIRLSSAQPWEEWSNEPFFIELMRAFSPVLDASIPLRD